MASDLHTETTMTTTAVVVPIGGAWLEGDLGMPPGARGLIVFAHGSGSSRQSPRNRAVARAFERRGLATLLIDLLTPEEEHIDRYTAQYRFDIERLARIVGGRDTPVIQMNRRAMALMPGEVRLELVPGATHSFEEPDALEVVAQLATQWFLTHLTSSATRRRAPARA
jgi:hypothetical protein